MTRDELRARAGEVGLTFATRKHPDSVTRYRFFLKREDGAERDYDEGSGLFTCHGMQEVEAWLGGYEAGVAACPRIDI